jgi:hypothetical protein
MFGWKTVVRLGLVAVLCFPVLQYMVLYLWDHGTPDGLIAGLVLALLGGLGDLLVAAFNEPIQTAIYWVVVAFLAKLAFKKW